MSKPRVGLQLIIYGERGSGERVREHLPGVLEEVAKAGYEGIEAGDIFRYVSVGEARTLLGETGLKLAGIHGGYADCVEERRLEENIAWLKEMGSRYLICSGVAPGEGIGPYREAAKTFNKAGAACRREGLVFCYHNHDWEFAAFGEKRGIHVLAEETDPALVKLCVDVYWVTMGGEKPGEFIARYRERAPYFHFKDGGPRGTFAELGRGQIDLPAAMRAALSCSPEWVVCEQDSTTIEPAQSITISRVYLKERLGV